ncbi:MAG: hypothetical protein KatS3mg112_0516 [Thermogutta sp.]|nr:MAG: hypothetical protein KatS3mg112_0516 [Thermogutta sp.]
MEACGVLNRGFFSCALNWGEAHHEADDAVGYPFAVWLFWPSVVWALFGRKMQGLSHPQKTCPTLCSSTQMIWATEMWDATVRSGFPHPTLIALPERGTALSRCPFARCHVHAFAVRHVDRRVRVPQTWHRCPARRRSNNYRAGAGHVAFRIEEGGLHDGGCRQVAPGTGCGGNRLEWRNQARSAGNRFRLFLHYSGNRGSCSPASMWKTIEWWGADPNDPIRVSYKEKIGDEPTGRERPDLLKYPFSHGHDGTIINGISRIGFMTGGKKARWVDEDMADVLTQKALRFMEDHRDKRFLLYFATHDIHVPRLPHPRFVGKSQCGLRGDAAVEFDWVRGRNPLRPGQAWTARQDPCDFSPVTTAPLWTTGIAMVPWNTWEITSQPVRGRGGKYSAFEGGTRVPHDRSLARTCPRPGKKPMPWSATWIFSHHWPNSSVNRCPTEGSSRQA